MNERSPSAPPLTDRRPTLRCPCGEAGVETTFVYDRPPEGEVLTCAAERYRREFRRCFACGHWFSHYDMPFSQSYDGDYLDAAYGGAAAARRRYDAVMALPPERSDNYGRARRVDAFGRARLPRRGGAPTLLDVGAGLGVFPAVMTRLGWAATALDPEPRNAEHYRTTVGAAPWICDFLADDLDGLGTFDAVTFNKVLEHAPDPAVMLARARPLVRDGGFIYVELPDAAAAVDGPAREEFGLGHDHVFSPASMAGLIERAGFAVQALERIREPSGKYTLWAFAVPA